MLRKRPEPGSGEAAFWELSGVSMLPSFATGDVVWSVKADPGRIRLGDIVFFARPESNDRVTMHRVWRKTRLPDGAYEFLTKGDSCWKWDPKFRSEHLLGIGIAVLRPSGWDMLDTVPVKTAQAFKGAVFLPFFWARSVLNGGPRSLCRPSGSYRKRPVFFWRAVRWALTRLYCAFGDHDAPRTSARRLEDFFNPDKNGRKLS